MDAAAAGAVWTPRPLNDLKISSIYNRSATEAPAEVSLELSYNILDSSCGCFKHSVAVQPFVMFYLSFLSLFLLIMLGFVFRSFMILIPT
jgi:hypothetical protein